MPEYQLTWVTSNLAVGYAPMSYAELDSIKEEGIDAIVNLCGEFCDLHEIEEKSGFEVFYLPIPDECAPDMEKMENALDWLDESIYLGKKVLVHCRHGMGRTGTFVSSYLIRRGLGLKIAEKKLEHTRAKATNYSQWRLLKKYQKKEGILKIREPSLESRNVVDLGSYFADYEALLKKIEEDIENSFKNTGKMPRCGFDTDECCYGFFEMQLIESVYLFNRMNKYIRTETRQEIIRKAIEVSKKIKKVKRLLEGQGADPVVEEKKLNETYSKEKILCPLNIESKCILYEFRPIRCRLHGIQEKAIDSAFIDNTLFDISRNVFFAFTGSFLEEKTLQFSLADAVSGRFVQEYFYYLAYLVTS